MKRIISVIFCLIFCCSCESMDRNQASMEFLERGQAKGKVIMTSDLRLGGSMENAFTFGAGDTNFSFNGEIDFSNNED